MDVFIVLSGDPHEGYFVQEAFTTRALADEYVEIAQRQKGHKTGYEVQAVSVRDSNPFRIHPQVYAARIGDKTMAPETFLAPPALSELEVYRHAQLLEKNAWGETVSIGYSSVSYEDAVTLATEAMVGKASEIQPHTAELAVTGI